MCKYKNIIDLTFENTKHLSNKDIFIINSDLFVLLHNGKDYCNCEDK
jgi:hypothetical protein